MVAININCQVVNSRIDCMNGVQAHFGLKAGDLLVVLWVSLPVTNVLF